MVFCKLYFPSGIRNTVFFLPHKISNPRDIYKIPVRLPLPLYHPLKRSTGKVVPASFLAIVHNAVRSGIVFFLLNGMIVLFLTNAFFFHIISLFPPNPL